MRNDKRAKARAESFSFSHVYNLSHWNLTITDWVLLIQHTFHQIIPLTFRDMEITHTCYAFMSSRLDFRALFAKQTFVRTSSLR